MTELLGFIDEHLLWFTAWVLIIGTWHPVSVRVTRGGDK